jgi:hypothetical protein
MLNLASRGAAVVLAGSAIALTAATLPAQAAATTTGWRAVTKVSVKGVGAVMTGVDAVRANDAWAGGFAATDSGKKAVGLIEHWSGTSWQAVKLPAKIAKAWAAPGANYVTIGASSSTNVWAVGEFPTASSKGRVAYLRLSGRTWTKGLLPGAGGSRFLLVTSVEVLGKSDTWVFGGIVNVTSTTESFVPYAARYNGSRWSTVKIPASGEITAVSAVSANNIWAVTGTSGLGQEILSTGAAPATSAVLHWNGKNWPKVASQPGLPTGGDLTSIIAGKQVLVGGDVATSGGGTSVQFVDQMSGSTWAAPVKLPKSGVAAASSNHLPYQIESLVPAGHGSYWALSGNLTMVAPKLWHYTGGKWSAPISPMFGNKHRALVQLAEVPGTGSVWGVGEVGPESTAKGLIALTGPTPR